MPGGDRSANSLSAGKQPTGVRFRNAANRLQARM
jgi:hypothetical protein